MAEESVGHPHAEGRGTMLTTCVFGGARPGRHPRAVELAEELGALIGRRGHRLVYGAGDTGIMGAVAGAAAAEGGAVTGVIPGWLHETEGGLAAHCAEVVVTEDLFERKRHMLENSDGFIALPGGYGTVDEILEVASLNYLGRMGKPIAVIDLNGCWSGLVKLFEDLQTLGFADRVPLFEVFHAAEAALDFIEASAVRAQPLQSRSNAPARV